MCCTWLDCSLVSYSPFLNILFSRFIFMSCPVLTCLFRWNTNHFSQSVFETKCRCIHSDASHEHTHISLSWQLLWSQKCNIPGKRKRKRKSGEENGKDRKCLFVYCHCYRTEMNLLCAMANFGKYPNAEVLDMEKLSENYKTWRDIVSLFIIYILFIYLWIFLYVFVCLFILLTYHSLIISLTCFYCYLYLLFLFIFVIYCLVSLFVDLFLIHIHDMIFIFIQIIFYLFIYFFVHSFICFFIYIFFLFYLLN